MFSKAFKFIGFIGGGILALGTGAVGSHFSQPHLESTFNPSRKEREDRLQESFKDAEDKIEVLTRNLGELNQTGELQKTNIKTLEDKTTELQTQLDTATRELSEKEQQLENAVTALQEQENLNQKQSTQINELTQKFNQKETELSRETASKNQIQSNLDAINKKLELTSEDILTEKAIKESSLNIKIRKITRESFSGGVATFNVINYENAAKTIKVKQDGRPNFEQRAEGIKRKGINFTLAKSFETWEKIIKLVKHELDYGYVAKSTDKEGAFIVNDKTVIQDIKLEEYFNQEYLEDAFKVLVAISYLDIFPVCHDSPRDGNNKPYVFCEKKDISIEFDKTDSWSWNAFTSTDSEKKKFDAYLHSFATINDFISYWTQKTVEFVRTGTIDLFDFLNPILLSKNYK